MKKRAIVLSYANQKGGSGKSTATLLTANALSQEPFNLKVLIVDADLQRTISKERLVDSQGDRAFPYPIITSNIKDRKIIGDIQDSLDKYDVILIDIPGVLYTDEKDQQEMATVLALCDVIIIPIQSTKPSIRASLEFLETCKKVKELRDRNEMKFEISCFINQKKNTTESKRSLPKLIEQIGLNYLEADLSERVYYTRVFDTYTSILIDKGDQAAYFEFNKFINRVLRKFEELKINRSISEINKLIK